MLKALSEACGFAAVLGHPQVDFPASESKATFLELAWINFWKKGRFSICAEIGAKNLTYSTYCSVRKMRCLPACRRWMAATPTWIVRSSETHSEPPQLPQVAGPPGSAGPSGSAGGPRQKASRAVGTKMAAARYSFGWLSERWLYLRANRIVPAFAGSPDNQADRVVTSNPQLFSAISLESPWT